MEGNIDSVVLVVLKQLKMKRDSRKGKVRISGGKVASFLQVGLGEFPKLSLVTWRWLSFPAGLHSIPGHEEPGLHGSGWEVFQFLSEDKVSMTLKRVSFSKGSMVMERMEMVV